MSVQSVLKREIWGCSPIFFSPGLLDTWSIMSYYWIGSVLSKQPRWWWINQDSSMAALKIIWSQLCTCNPVSRLLTHHSWSFIHKGLFVIKSGYLCFSWEWQTFARLSSAFNTCFVLFCFLMSYKTYCLLGIDFEVSWSFPPTLLLTSWTNWNHY